MSVNDSRSSRRSFAFRLYMSRDLNRDESKTTSRSSVNKILKKAVCIVNCLKMSLFISKVIVILRCTTWDSIIIASWLCFESLILYNQHWMFSSNLTIMKNEHWICLLSQWRRFYSMTSWVLRSRSHIIHVLLITSFFDFFVRFRTTAYSFDSTCWLIARRRLFR
jgi:hypothetical protein